jgi:putative transposase
VNTDGRREILGTAVGPTEAEPFWSKFIRSLTSRGLRGVKLIISDAHEGIKAAARKVLRRLAVLLPIGIMMRAGSRAVRMTTTASGLARSKSATTS